MAVIEIDLHTLSDLAYVRRQIKSLEAKEEVLMDKLVTAIKEVGNQSGETKEKQGG